jgi:hypothetical protein
LRTANHFRQCYRIPGRHSADGAGLAWIFRIFGQHPTTECGLTPLFCRFGRLIAPACTMR